jgi:GNAT superfamily N-acetyltransferase
VSLDICPVRTRRDRRAFVEFAYSMYKDHEHWVPPLRRDEYRRLSPAHNPFFEHAEMALWLARSNGVVVGRVAAIDDRLHNDTHGERCTWFGFFEAADRDVAAALLTTVEKSAAARGSSVVRGPANPSLNETAGLLIDAFETDPYVLMPYNRADYAASIEAAGYRKAKDLLAWEFDMTAPLGERVLKAARRLAERHGVVVRAVELAQFDREVRILQDIYRAAWAGNWGFVPPTDAEIRQLATDLKPVIEPELVLFAELQGRPVACAVGLPDLNQVLKRMNGRLFPFGLWHFLRRRSTVTQGRLLLLGVLPELQSTGLYALLVAEMYTRAKRAGLQRAELSWTLEDNVAINAGIEAAGGRRHKTYRLYEKHL